MKQMKVSCQGENREADEDERVRDDRRQVVVADQDEVSSYC